MDPQDLLYTNNFLSTDTNIKEENENENENENKNLNQYLSNNLFLNDKINKIKIVMKFFQIIIVKIINQ